MTDWLTLDANLALTQSRFVDVPASAREIPNSVGRVLTAGATINWPNGLFGVLRLRHFGDSPLEESGQQNAEATTFINLSTGCQHERFKLVLEVLNLFDSRDPDISYFYGSRLSEESAEGIDDVHYHPVVPRTIRASISIGF